MVLAWRDGGGGGCGESLLSLEREAWARFLVRERQEDKLHMVGGGGASQILSILLLDGYKL